MAAGVIAWQRHLHQESWEANLARGHTCWPNLSISGASHLLLALHNEVGSNLEHGSNPRILSSIVGYSNGRDFNSVGFGWTGLESPHRGGTRHPESTIVSVIDGLRSALSARDVGATCTTPF